MSGKVCSQTRAIPVNPNPAGVAHFFEGEDMSTATGAQSRGQLTTIIVLAVALALSVAGLVISVVQVTKEKAAIQSAADNAQVVTKEVATDSDSLNQSIQQNSTAISELSKQAGVVAEEAGALKTDTAAQAKAMADLKTGSDKVAGEITSLTTSVTGLGTSLGAQQNASTALLSLVTDLQSDPQVGISTLATTAQSLSDSINKLCGGASSCTISQADLNSIIAEAASLSTGLATQNTALSSTDPTVSAIAAAKSLNSGLTAIQTAGNAASASGKTLLADMKTLGTATADSATAAKKISDNAAKLSDNAAGVNKSASSTKQSSATLATQGANFNQDIQDLSSGAYQPDLAELSIPTAALVAVVSSMVLLVVLVIWLAVLARRARRS